MQPVFKTMVGTLMVEEVAPIFKARLLKYSGPEYIDQQYPEISRRIGGSFNAAMRLAALSENSGEVELALLWLAENGYGAMPMYSIEDITERDKMLKRESERLKEQHLPFSFTRLGGSVLVSLAIVLGMLYFTFLSVLLLVMTLGADWPQLIMSIYLISAGWFGRITYLSVKEEARSDQWMF